MKKRGKQIKNRDCVIPLGIKRTSYEINARAAMLAIERRICNEQHLVDLFVLADLCERLNESKERHIDTHAESVKKLVEAIHNKSCDGLASLSIKVSANILLDWFHGQDNKRVLDIANQQIKRFLE